MNEWGNEYTNDTEDTWIKQCSNLVPRPNIDRSATEGLTKVRERYESNNVENPIINAKKMAGKDKKHWTENTFIHFKVHTSLSKMFKLELNSTFTKFSYKNSVIVKKQSLLQIS